MIAAKQPADRDCARSLGFCKFPIGGHERFAQWFSDFDDVEIEVLQQIAESDRVVTQMVMKALHRATHRNVSLATIRIDRIVKGKISENWSVADMAGPMQ